MGVAAAFEVSKHIFAPFPKPNRFHSRKMQEFVRAFYGGDDELRKRLCLLRRLTRSRDITRRIVEHDIEMRKTFHIDMNLLGPCAVSTYTTLHDKRHGRLTRTDPRNNKLVVEHYMNGVLHGERRVMDSSDGFVFEFAHFKHGKRHGIGETYGQNRKLFMRMFHQDDIAVWVESYDNQGNCAVFSRQNLSEQPISPNPR